MRLTFSHLVATKPSQAAYPVRTATPLEFVEPRELCALEGHDKFAADLVRDFVLVRELRQRRQTLAAELRLKGLGRVVQACVHDARVSSALMLRDLTLLLQDDDAQPRPLA